MPFTTLDLNVLDPIFDKRAADSASAVKQVVGQREAELDAVGKLIDGHKQKLTDAKARK